MSTADRFQKKVHQMKQARDDAIDQGDALEKQIQDMEAELLKVELEKKELERRLKLTEDEVEAQDTIRTELRRKSNQLQVEDQRIRDEIKTQIQAIEEMEALIKDVDERYEVLENDYNETMEDINAL